MVLSACSGVAVARRRLSLTRAAVPRRAGGRAGARGRGPAQPAASLDEALAACLPPHEAQRWKELIEADGEQQRRQLLDCGDGGECGGQAPPRAAFSDAYLAALPPRAAAGLLRLLDEEEEAEEEEEEEESEEEQTRTAGSPAAAAAP